jgi:hypothetical protein
MLIEARKSPANGALLVKPGSSSTALRHEYPPSAPPLLLHVGLREPLEVLERVVLALGVRDDRQSLTAELRVVLRGARIDEESDAVRAHFLVEAGEEREPVHLHRDLARLEGVEALLHVRVGHPRCRAALEDFLVGLQPLHGARRIDEAFHLIRLLRVVVFEPIRVEDVRHPIVMPSEPRSVKMYAP